jgi:dTDP-4-dehydrorhamnose 3,5-epimerase|tara:strand:- start:54 stop:605 length:552 start_codon:yes stop_codon:yes gene_type:complete
MKIKSLPIKGAFEVELVDLNDSRGTFKRLFCSKELDGMTSSKQIVQINASETFQKGSIRGMHFQNSPRSEIKLIQCIQGSVFDVMIDLRKSSNTFLQWHAIELSSQKNNMIIIPEGCAHGFQTLSENSKLLYFHTEFYSPEHESGIRYDDPLIGIKWPLEIDSVSDRDKNHQLLSNKFEGLEE